MKRRRFGPPPPPAYSRSVPNVIPGGSGHFMGPFRRRPLTVRESAVTQYGFQQEVECFGEISANDVQYIGVQSVNPNMIAKAIGAALIRHIFRRHYGKTYANLQEPLVGSDALSVENGMDLYRIDFITRTRSSDGTTTAAVNSGPTITVQTLLGTYVDYIETQLLQNNQWGMVSQNGNEQWYLSAYRFVYRNATSATVSNTYEIPVNIESLRLHLSVHQRIHLQNVTRANTAGVTAGGSRDAVDANPITGRIYTMKGMYPVIEQTSWTDSFAQTLTKFQQPRLNGIFLPVGTVANPTNTWRSLPNPQVFNNIISCQTGLRLEPGDIKTDYVRYSFNGKLNDLISSMNVLSPISTVGGYEAINIRNVSPGVYKLYAFEKVVPTGSDSVEMNYHIDRFISCVVTSNRHNISCAREYAQFKYDNKTGTYPALLRGTPTVADVPEDAVVDSPDD